MEIITRKEAIALKLKRYYTGEPCPNGHIGERYVKGNGGCVQCSRDRVRRYASACNDSRETKVRHRGSSMNHEPTIKGARLIKGRCQSGSSGE